MNQEPEKRGFLYENFVLVISRVARIRNIVDRLMNRKVYKDLPESVKDDVKEIREITRERPNKE